MQHYYISLMTFNSCNPILFYGNEFIFAEDCIQVCLLVCFVSKREVSVCLVVHEYCTLAGVARCNVILSPFPRNQIKMLPLLSCCFLLLHYMFYKHQIELKFLRFLV